MFPVVKEQSRSWSLCFKCKYLIKKYAAFKFSVFESLVQFTKTKILRENLTSYQFYLPRNFKPIDSTSITIQ